MRLLSVVCPVPANAQWFRKWSVLSTVEVCKYKLEMAVKKEAFISLLVSLLVAQTNSFTKKNEKTGVTDVCLVNINHSPSVFTFSLPRYPWGFWEEPHDGVPVHSGQWEVPAVLWPHPGLPLLDLVPETLWPPALSGGSAHQGQCLLSSLLLQALRTEVLRLQLGLQSKGFNIGFYPLIYIV